MSKAISLKEAFEIMKRANKIVITSHIHPDGDSIGSSLTMYHVLHNLNKEVKIFINDKIPAWCEILEDNEKISRIPDKNYSADLIILPDASISRVGNICSMINAPVLNIDHHVSNDNSADYLYLDSEASSTCEILFRFMQENELEIDEKIANCLYAGLATDTGFFKFDNTSESALKIAAELVKCGAKPSLIADSVATKTLRELELMSKAMQTLKLFKDNKVIGLILADEKFAELELTDDLIDMIRFTKDIDVAFLIRYERANVYRLRMRSRVTNLSKLLEPIGGGGHIHAAGATLKGEKAIDDFIKFLEESELQ